MDELKKKILDSEIISFDMFDTLVLRVVDSPDTVFDMIGNKFNIDNFKNIRKNMQKECSLELMNKYGYPHANIDEIYDYIKKHTNIKDTQKIMNYEIELEQKLLYQNKEMYDIYAFAKKNNKKVIVTSDMYLKLDFIEKVLNNCGYTEIDKIYLSSESRKAKFNGELYDEIISSENVKPNKIIHIGDNFKDDIQISTSKGINNYYYQGSKFDCIASNIEESIHNGIVRYIEKSESNFWIKLASHAGLMYQALINNLEKIDYDTINFLARDGYNLYHLLKKINTSKKIQYAYTSRRALLLASITKLDANSINNLPPFTVGQTIEEILEYIDMKNIFSINDLKKVGFASFKDKINNIDDISRFKKIYLLREKEVLKVCEKEKKYAEEYFEKLNIYNKKNLFFDCGWNGSSQYLLENFVCSIYPRTDFEFYYTGIFDTQKSRFQLKSKKYKSYLFDIDKNQDIVNRIRDSIVILELFFGAPENSIIKYDKNGPVFDNFESNLNYKKNILEGLEKYLVISNDLFKELDIEIDSKVAIKPLLRLIENPTLEEAINIGNIENVDAFAKQKGVKKYIANISYDVLKDNPNIEIYWKYGLIKRNDIDDRVKKYVMKKYKLKPKSEKTKIKCIINGINNPLLIVTVNQADFSIGVLEDNEKVLMNKEIIGEQYVYTGSLTKDNSVIDINITGKKISITKKIRNYKFRRIIQKLHDVCLKIIRKVGRPFKKLFNIIKGIILIFIRGINYAWKNYHFLIPPKEWKKLFKKFINRIRNVDSNSPVLNPFNQKEYLKWLKMNEKKSKYEELEYKPLISFVIPVYNVSKKLLTECINSILNQTYSNYEICIADDCSTKKETIETLKKLEKKSDKIKVIYRKENGHISKASNTALELVTGEYVAMMDNDDVIPKNALYEMVKAINKDKTIDMIYTDEDKLDYNGKRCDPHIKSDYAPDTLLSLNYFCHFTLLRTTILKEIGGWKTGYEGSQDYDLFLRFTEKAKNIYHLPMILYHWRKIPGSTSMGLNQKNYAMLNGKKALEDALKRRKTPGNVHIHDKVPYYWIEYTYKKEPMVSIIIPTKDYAQTLDSCLKSIYEKTTYKNFEVIVVDNRSEKEETFKLFEKYKKKYKNFSVVKADIEFNYSKINNIAAKNAKGDYLLLLNNDTEVITENWIELMVGYAMQKHIGAVGVKLIFPDKTIQHGGVVLGMGGVAGHAYINEPQDYNAVYGRLSVPYNYSVVTAACLMIEKKKFEEVNGLTEELKVAYNDVDFCLKLQKKGYYNIFLPMVELYHYESKSRGLEDTEEKKKRFQKEVAYMEKHWQKVIENDPLYNKNLSRLQVFMLDKNNEE